MRIGAFACYVWKWYVCGVVGSKLVVVVYTCTRNAAQLACDIKQRFKEYIRCLQAGLTCTNAGLMAHHDEVSTPEKAKAIFQEILSVPRLKHKVCDKQIAT